MSNKTVQQIANAGFKPLFEEELSLDNAIPLALTAVANTQMIIIKMPDDISGGAKAYIGSSTVANTTGLPIFDTDGLGHWSNTTGFSILTDSPASFYLIANVRAVKVRVLYLGFN